MRPIPQSIRGGALPTHATHGIQGTEIPKVPEETTEKRWSTKVHPRNRRFEFARLRTRPAKPLPGSSYTRCARATSQAQAVEPWQLHLERHLALRR